MLLGWRRLLPPSSNRRFRWLRTLCVRDSDGPALFLSPEVVESTLSRCPSDTVALSFFLWCARQPNYFHDGCSFERMAPVVCRLTERLGSVREVVGELETVGCLTKAQTFMILLRICWRGKLYRLAFEVFDEMGKRNFVPNTFARNIVLDILFKTGQFDSAMGFFRSISLPNFLSYNIVLCNICNSHFRLEALEIFKEMIMIGFNLNIGTFVMVLDFLSKAGRIAELQQLVAFMIVSGKELNETVWTIFIDGLRRAGKIIAASTLVDKMIESGCQPTVVTYTSLIKGLVEARMIDKAFVVLDNMLSSVCSPDLIFYNVLIHSLSNAGKYNEAIGVFCLLQKNRLRPDSYTMSSLIHTLCLSRQMKLLPKLIEGCHGSFDIVACNSLIHAFCKVGLPSQAVRLFQDMLIRGLAPDSYTYVGLLNSLCMQGNICKAVNVYDYIILNEPNLDEYVHSTILRGLVKQRKFQMAIKLFRRAIHENYCLDVVSYTIAIDGLFRGHRIEEACCLFEQMKHSGIAPNTHTYNMMLRGLCKARRFDAINQLLRDMELTGSKINNLSFNTLSFLFKICHLNSAIILCKKMCDLGMDFDKTTYSLLSDLLVSRGLEEYNRKSTSFVEKHGSLSDTEYGMPNDIVCCAN